MLNMICLQGRLVHNPEVKYTPNGAAVTTFAVAVERNRAGQDGQRQVDYIDVVAWQKTAEFIGKYFGKGSMIIINGALQTRTYDDKEGKKRKVFEVVADNVNFGGGKSEGGKPETGDADDSAYINPHESQPARKFSEVQDDDLPF